MSTIQLVYMNMLNKSDEEIVQMTLENINNYRYIIERYEGKLMRYIRGLLYVNTEDAEDILQEVFIKAYRNLNSFNPKYKFSNWIYRIAHNEAVSFLRKNKKRKLEIANDPEKDIFENLASDLDLEKEYMEEDSAERVGKILAKLDTKYRDVLVLKYLEGKDYNEISEILHIPSGTVGSLISRAKIKLKDMMISDGGDK